MRAVPLTFVTVNIYDTNQTPQRTVSIFAELRNISKLKPSKKRAKQGGPDRFQFYPTS